MFLPSMHDRYSYFVMVMLALVALLDRRMIGVALVSIGISTVLYLRYLLNADAAIDLWRSSKSSTTVALRRAPSCTRSRSICTVLDKKTTPTLSTRKVGALLFFNVKRETCEITAGLVPKQDEERCVAHRPFALT